MAEKIKMLNNADPGRYYLTASDDTRENGRLSAQHDLWLVFLDGALYTAPLAMPVHNILDMGCGSGAWTISAARKHPTATVLGVDLTPPSKSKSTPANCTFVRANAEDAWTFPQPRTGFDLVFARMLANGIHDWPAFFARCFASLRPGGWLEVPDVRVAGVFSKSGQTEHTSALLRWHRLFEAQARHSGIDPDANALHARRMRDVGFVNISARPVEWYLGGECGATEKERFIGAQNRAVTFDLIDGVTENILQHQPGWDRGEARELARLAKEDLRLNQREGQYYLQLSLHIAQKPFKEASRI